MSNKNQEVHLQKLANLEQRLERWEKIKKQNRKDMVINAMLIFPVVTFLMYGIAYVNEMPLDLSILGKSVLTGILLMIPLVIIQQSKPYNRKPTQADVYADIELRKSVGMDSQVNK